MITRSGLRLPRRSPRTKAGEQAGLSQCHSAQNKLHAELCSELPPGYARDAGSSERSSGSSLLTVNYLLNFVLNYLLVMLGMRIVQNEVLEVVC